MESKKVFCKRASDIKSLSELNLPDHLEKIIRSCDLSAEHLIEIVRKDKYLFSDDGDYLYEVLLERALKYDAVTCDEYLYLSDASFGEIYDSIKQPLEKAGWFREDDDFIAGNNIVNYMLDMYSDWLFSIGFCWSDRGVFMKNYEEHPPFTDEDYAKIINEALCVYKKILSPEQYSVVERDLTTYEDYPLTEKDVELLKSAMIDCRNGKIGDQDIFFIVRDIVLSY